MTFDPFKTIDREEIHTMTSIDRKRALHYLFEGYCLCCLERIGEYPCHCGRLLGPENLSELQR